MRSRTVLTISLVSHSQPNDPNSSSQKGLDFLPRMLLEDQENVQMSSGRALLSPHELRQLCWISEDIAGPPCAMFYRLILRSSRIEFGERRKSFQVSK